MPSATPAAISPPTRPAALRTNIKTSLENCALRFLVVVEAHHRGSADRCQAPTHPSPGARMPQCPEERLARLTRPVRSEFRPQINAALPRQRDSAALGGESQAASS